MSTKPKLMLLAGLLSLLLAVILISSAGGSARPSTASLLSTACSEVSHYDSNAVVRMSSSLPAGYAACAAPGEHPAVDSERILRSDPGPGYTVSYY